MKDINQGGATERAHEARDDAGHDSIKDLVMQEAAAAIMAAGRELTGNERRLTTREFWRGPALKVGLALSVMGVTMWIAQLNQEHRAQKARRSGASAAAQSRQRRARGSVG